jgi:esterase/lipase
MGHYKTIEGIKYEQELLDVAQKATEGKGESRISYDEAKSLIDSALDGGRITRTERRTLHYIFDNFTLTDKAKDYMVEQLFKLQDNVHYDMVLIDAAELAIQGRGDGRISLDDAELIWKMIESDGKVTAVERRTLGYILEKYKCTEPATAFLQGHLG